MAALEVFRTSNLPHESALVLVSLGYLAELRGDADAAYERHADGLAAARQSGNARAMALAVEGLAGANALAGNGERAARLLGLAAALRDRAGGPLTEPERGDVNRATERCLAAIGRDAFDAAFQWGRRSHLDDEGLVGPLLAGSRSRGET